MLAGSWKRTWPRSTAITIAVNGNFLYTKHAALSMIERGTRGSIISVLSSNAWQGAPGFIAYATHKGGLANFVRAAAMDLAPYGIRVNSFTPTAPRPDNPELLAQWRADGRTELRPPRRDDGERPPWWRPGADVERGAAVVEVTGPSPAELARRFHYDTLVFDHRALRYIIDLIGPDRLFLGSDFPAMRREEPTGRTLRAMGLPEHLLEDITWHNCFRFLGIHAPKLFSSREQLRLRWPSPTVDVSGRGRRAPATAAAHAAR